MAKARPLLTLLEMESKLGYKVDSFTYPIESLDRFYSDLTPVPHNTYQRTKEEFEKHEKNRSRKDCNISEKAPLALGVANRFTHGEDTVTLTCWSHVVFCNVNVDINHGFGLNLPLLFTSDEAFNVMSVAKLQSTTNYSETSTFFKLPREVRDKIYLFALPEGKWRIANINECDEFDFSRHIGDPSGFYFPLSKELTVLRVNRQMRQEALPLAYRRTAFHLGDMDDLVKLLIAFGTIGRSNIESLELTWESGADSAWKWERYPDIEDPSLTLPVLHATKCVQLLKQCKRLQFLRLFFESDLINNISHRAYRADPGIRGLCSMGGIKRVEIWDLEYRPLDQDGLAKWLKEAMEAAREEGQDRERAQDNHEK